MKSEFKPLSEKEILQLPSLLRKHLPYSAVAHNVVQLHLQNRHNSNHIQIKFYSCTPLLLEDSLTFLVCFLQKTYEETEVVVFVSANPSTESLEIFEHLINWTQPHTFASTNGVFKKIIKELCGKHGMVSEFVQCKFNVMSEDKYKTNSEICTKQEYLENRSGNTLSLSENILIFSLTKQDSTLVTQKWKYAREDTQTEMEDIIEKIASCGLQINSELVSWMVLNQIGTMSALYTEDLHRGKGYGEIVVRNMTKSAYEMGLIPCAEMEWKNDSSYKVFNRVGYEYSFESHWVTYSPK